MTNSFESLTANQVFCAHTPGRMYGDVVDATFPELPGWAKATPALAALRSIFADAGLDHEHMNSPSWNPLAALIEGKKVVLKPNWVYHENASGQGLDCLITHVSVLEAILHYIAKARPAAIVLGDAPIQGCDFTALLVHAGVTEMTDRFASHDIEVRVKDFRRTIRPGGKLATRPVDGGRSLDEFILFDLGAESELEEITQPDSEFRVTMYNPDLLKRTHAPGKHQYLIARDVIEGDVIISVPKLKTHKKACITGALKNLVGINGHKEYLPHHRKGNPQNGGDCYPEPSSVKAFVEDLADATNRSEGKVSRWLLANSVRVGTVFGRWLNLGDNYEGSWHGNDTVWRMTLDLQRILLYGRQDGTLAEAPQRTVLSVTDAMIAGEGDGPLAPTPVNLGMITLGGNSAAVEWVNALLMGLMPAQIPLTREAFTRHRYPLVDFNPESVAPIVNGKRIRTDEIFRRYGRVFRLPSGWQKPPKHISAEAPA